MRIGEAVSWAFWNGLACILSFAICFPVFVIALAWLSERI